VSYAGKIAEALVTPMTSSDTYFDNAAKTFLRALILYVFLKPPELRNLVHLRKLVTEGETEAGLRGTSFGENVGGGFDLLLARMKACPAGPYRDVIAGAAASLIMMGDRQRGSVVTTAQEHTAFLDVPEIRRISQHSDFLLDDFKLTWMSVYLCLPLNLIKGGQEARWLRMFVMLFVDMMTRNPKAPNPPVLLAIDEFPALGHMQSIDTVAPQLRSAGVRLWVVGQDIEQFKAAYPDSWGGFVGGAEAVQFMGITHPETVRFAVELLGKHVVTEIDRFGKQSRRMPVEYPLLDANQLAQMLAPHLKNQIVWRGSRRPMLLKTTPYYDYLPWWYYDRDPRYSQKFNRWLWRRGKPKYRGPIPPSELVPPTLPAGPPPGGDVSLIDPALLPLLRSVPGSGVGNGRQDAAGSAGPSAADNLAWPPMPPASSPAPPSTPVSPPPAARPRRSAPKPRARKPEAAPGAPPADPSDPFRALDNLIGLDGVKAQVRTTMDLVALSRAREQVGMPKLDLTYHLVFTGNPGTGKTTVARLVGQIYKTLGVLEKGHLVEVDRGDLIGSYVGQTAPKVKDAFAKALGGVLFIDEAYSLAGGGAKDYGAEAIQAIVKLMEDNRDRVAVIAAGYAAEMQTFIDANPGLKSRFKTFIDFPDYSADEMLLILDGLMKSAGCRMSVGAETAAAALLKKVPRGPGFGNGRTVRNIFEACIARQAQRLVHAGMAKTDLAVFEAEDIPPLKDVVI
jgi:hypothetical protein